MSRQLPTIRDVADLAGVSPATVSNVLGGRRKVAQELTIRVQDAVRQLGYVADHAASRLRSGRAGVVGALVPDLANPFFSAFVAELEALARHDGYALLVAGSGGNPEHEAQRLRALVAWRPAGIVVIPADDAFAARALAEAAGVPLVVADRIPDLPGHDAVGIDNASAAGTAMRHLLQLGHRSILVVASSRQIGNVRERLAGIEQALAVASGDARVEVVEAGFDTAHIRETLVGRLRAGARPTAVLTLNIDATLCALEAIAGTLLAVPRDLALVSFDDYEWMRVATPAISAVRQPIEEIARAVWARMRARIAGDSSPPQEIRLACSFEVRASSGRPVGPAPAVARLSSDGLVISSPGRTRMQINRRSALSLTAGAVAAGALPDLARPAFAAGEEVAVVVKIGGIPWFNAMETGIMKTGKELDLNAYMIGPTDADPAQQVRAVEDLIAKQVAVIAVVPNDAQALEPVFERAQAAGIPVITHESPDQRGNSWNIEMVDSVKFGEAHMERLAEAMGGEGEYIVYVGSLTVPLHNFWADKSIEYQKAKYPNMTMVTDRFGVAESVDDSYRTAVDMFKAHPDLKGILAYGSNGPIGAGRAIVDQGKVGKVSLVGPFTPGQGADLLKQDAIIEGFIWNPMEAGVAIVQVANMVIKGQPITDGMEIPGMGKVAVDPATRNIRAHKLQPINKETIDGLVALGL